MNALIATRNQRLVSRNRQVPQLVHVRCLACVGKAAGRVLPVVQVELMESADVASRRAVILAVGMLFQAHLSPNAPAASAQLEPLDDLKERIRTDFVDRQYYVTGNLSPELYEDDCTFIDPTVEVKGVKKYVEALKTLFDPSKSKAELIAIEVDSPSTITLKWRLEGYLRLGGLQFKPYTGTTTYYIDAKQKIRRHEETWDISVVDAFVSTFLPSFGAPPAPALQQPA